MINLLASLPKDSPAELVDILAENQHVRIERIVSIGHCSEPEFWYDQSEHEWVLLLQGQAELQFADGSIHRLHRGDQLLIPAHQRHRVHWTTPDQPTVWLAVFYSAEPESAS